MSTGITKAAEDVFLQVADLPAAARRAALDRLCAGDAELRASVEGLLKFHSGADEFLERPEFLTQVSPRARHAEEEDNLAPGTRIGGFTVRGLLGSGGMGSVYIAEQERPRRTVALKVIRRGYATPSLLRRFEHEAEVLGRLQHPGIAQIYEAGAAVIEAGEAPQLFIAIELIRGPTLNAFVEQHSSNVRHKLELIARVCDAVHHAHQRGVIHRDLKPQNILVDESGQPKVLDFGVARATDADLRVTTLQTSVGQLIGTLPYMSPEQVLADPVEVDNRSDAYALGVVLYQLLTGRLPLDVSSRSIPEAARVIRDQTPARLSSVSKVYRGDIETIVSKALDKDKARRYQSAADLAADIRPFLAGEPIAAKVDSSLYVLRTQLRRYRGVVIAAAIFLFAVMAFAVHATMQWRTNADLRHKADAQSEHLRKSLYLSNIGFAQAAHVAHDSERMTRILDQCPPDLRGWEWMYLRRISDDTAYTFTVAELHIAPLIISPDGALAAVASHAGHLALVDSVTGAEKHRIGGRQGPQESPAIPGKFLFSPDGRFIFIGWNNGLVERVEWATQTRTPLHVHAGPPDSANRYLVRKASRDGRWLCAVTIGYAEVLVADAATGVIANRLKVPDTSQSTLTPDRRALVVGFNNGHMSLLDRETAAVIRELPGHTSQVRYLEFSPDGTRLASACADKTVRLWNLDTGESVALRDFENKINSVGWSRDGTRLAAGGTDRVIKVFDPRTGQTLQTLSGHTSTIRGVWFPPTPASSSPPALIAPSAGGPATTRPANAPSESAAPTSGTGPCTPRAARSI